jgi:hypothetical protein
MKLEGKRVSLVLMRLTNGKRFRTQETQIDMKEQPSFHFFHSSNPLLFKRLTSSFSKYFAFHAALSVLTILIARLPLGFNALHGKGNQGQNRVADQGRAGEARNDRNARNDQ